MQRRSTDLPPEPLVAADVDLRDFGYMPLDALRLRDSELAIEASPEVFRASVLLWCASWHQVPAGSLPMKDKTLAEYSRAGTRWPRIRAEVLSKWVECADGRLYHPVVAEKAREAQAAKDAQRARTKAATEAREAKRRSTAPGLDDPPRGGRDGGRDDQRHVQRDEQRDVERNVVQGKGREGKGTEGIKEKETSLLAQAPLRPSAERPQPPQLSLVEPAPERAKGPPDCPHVLVLALWAEVLPQLPQHEPDQWKGQRADHLRARWREVATAKDWPSQDAGLAYLRRLFAYVGRSPFLTGRVTPRDPNKRPFVVTLAWLVKPENWAKTVEGEYHEESA